MEISELYEIYRSCSGRVATDSRAIEGGELFFALKGENFDGNRFAAAALQAGASYAVVDASADLSCDDRFIRVPDVFVALQELAVWHREHVSGPGKRLPVIGLTGTNGKTTTKNLISAVLSRKYRVTATAGNFNNDIGVPLSLLKITPDTEIAVIEMGANHPDDIAKLVKVSRPDYGLITNVGKAHLLGFGSFEGVKAAKGELYNWLGTHRGSLIFLNEDDADLREMASKQPCHCFGYGLAYQRAEVLPLSAQEPFVRIRLGADIIRTQLVGAYNAQNVLAALAVGEYFGVSRADAIMRRTLTGCFLVGDEFGRALTQFTDKNLTLMSLAGASIWHCDTSEALFDFLKENVLSAATVLVKGSRGIQMEKVLTAL